VTPGKRVLFSVVVVTDRDEHDMKYRLCTGFLVIFTSARLQLLLSAMHMVHGYGDVGWCNAINIRSIS
jgi:hypothetical protein